MRASLVAGVNSRKSRVVEMEPDAFAEWLMDPEGKEALFTLGVFADGGRRKSSWEGADGVVLDIDLKVAHEVTEPSGVTSRVTAKAEAAPLAGRLVDAWDAGAISGSVMYVTPHGVRIIYLGDTTITDATVYTLVAADLLDTAAREVGTVLADEVANGLIVRGDECSLKAAQIYYLPNVTVDGEERAAHVLGRTGEDGSVARFPLAPVDRSEEAHEAPPAPPPPPPVESPAPPPPRAWEPSTDVDEAKEAFNHHAVHPARALIGSADGYCPGCSAAKGAPTADGRLKAFLVDDVPVPGRWTCYGDSHPSTLGVGSFGGGHTGDLLDLVEFISGTGRVDILRNLGFLVDAPAEEAEPAAPLAPGEDGRADIHVANEEQGVTIHAFATNVAEACRGPNGPMFYTYGGAPAFITTRNTERDGPLNIVSATKGNASLFSVMAERNVRLINTVMSGRGKNRKRVHVPITPQPRDGVNLVNGLTVSEAAPPLHNVVTFPCLLPDGTITEPGFNEEAGVWYAQPSDLRGLTIDPNVKPMVRRGVLESFLADTTKVVGPHGRAIVVSMLVTAIIRAGCDLASPGFGFISNQPGSGKSTTGRDTIGATLYGSAPIALTESLTTHKGKDALNHHVAQDPHPVLFFDNARNDSRVDSAELAAKVTEPTISCGRLAYGAGISTVRNKFLFIVNGNRLEFDADLVQRLVPVRFAKPDGFDGFADADPLAHALNNRRRVLSTILGAVKQAADKYGANLTRWPGQATPVSTWEYTQRWTLWYTVVGTVMDLLGFNEWMRLPEDSSVLDDGEVETLLGLVYEIKRAGRDPMHHGVSVSHKDGNTLVTFKVRDLADALPDEVLASLPGSTNMTPNTRLGNLIGSMVGHAALPIGMVKGPMSKGYRKWIATYPPEAWAEEEG